VSKKKRKWESNLTLVNRIRACLDLKPIHDNLANKPKAPLPDGMVLWDTWGFNAPPPATRRSEERSEKSRTT
jgi:hypothetical protein